MPRESLSLAQARRVTLAAQGFTDPRHAVPTMRTLARTVERTGVLQVDSVNVLQRAHFMPLWSRMGAYDVDLLRRAAEDRPRKLVEYWAHVQALMPVDLWPAMRPRMRQYAEHPRRQAWARANAALVDRVLDLVRDGGASTARDLDDGAPREKLDWGWNWSQAREALNHLFIVGEVAIAGRTSQFEPVYDLPERVLPAAVVDAPEPTPAEAVRELVRRSARSHGVGTLKCLSDYYRLQHVDGQKAARVAVDELVEAGELTPVRVEGWQRDAWLHRDAKIPRRIGARALLSPFDPVVWERDRTERLFGFHYRIEIYVPKEKRQYGYYVLPFLLGDEVVARVDLKADRLAGRADGTGGVLRVQSAWAEPGAPPDTAAELADELRDLAAWLGLGGIAVAARGDLAPALAQLV